MRDAHYTSTTLVAEITRLREEKKELVEALKMVLSKGLGVDAVNTAKAVIAKVENKW